MCASLPAQASEHLEHSRLLPRSALARALSIPAASPSPILPQLDVLLISEDSDNHENNVLWSYDIPRRE